MKYITDHDWWAPTKNDDDLKSDEDDSILNEDVDDSNSNSKSNNKMDDDEMVILNEQIYAEFESCENPKITTPKRPRSSPCRKNVSRAPRNYKQSIMPLQFPKEKKLVSNPRLRFPVIR